MPKRETNEELIVRLLNFGPYGPMQQVFILQAIEQYAKAVAAAPVEALDTPLLDGASWQGTAKYLLGELNEHYSH